MEQYISKSALIAEIKKLLAFYSKEIEDNKEDPWAMDIAKRDILQEVLSFINTLEVKEVDLEKAIDDYIYTHDGRKRLALEPDWKYCNLTLKGGNEIIKFARHFFELGLKASNPITATDRGTAEEIIINLKRVEKDYRINLTREIEWLRNKVKKGD